MLAATEERSHGPMGCHRLARWSLTLVGANTQLDGEEAAQREPPPDKAGGIIDLQPWIPVSYQRETPRDKPVAFKEADPPPIRHPSLTLFRAEPYHLRFR
jgi:hypothetical protein